MNPKSSNILLAIQDLGEAQKYLKSSFLKREWQDRYNFFLSNAATLFHNKHYIDSYLILNELNKIKKLPKHYFQKLIESERYINNTESLFLPDNNQDINENENDQIKDIYNRKPTFINSRNYLHYLTKTFLRELNLFLSESKGIIQKTNNEQYSTLPFMTEDYEWIKKLYTRISTINRIFLNASIEQTLEKKEEKINYWDIKNWHKGTDLVFVEIEARQYPKNMKAKRMGLSRKVQEILDVASMKLINKMSLLKNEKIRKCLEIAIEIENIDPYFLPFLPIHLRFRVALGLEKLRFVFDKALKDNELRTEFENYKLLQNKKVFISYSTRSEYDLSVRDILAQELSSRDIEVKLDIYTMKANMDIQEEIKSLIKESDFTICLLSKKSMKSLWVGLEWVGSMQAEDFKNGQYSLIPVILEPDVISNEFKNEFEEHLNSEKEKLSNKRNELTQANVSTSELNKQLERIIIIAGNQGNIFNRITDHHVPIIKDLTDVNLNIPKIISYMATQYKQT